MDPFAVLLGIFFLWVVASNMLALVLVVVRTIEECLSVGQAAGRAETEEAFNNYMERVIGKTFMILSIFNSIHP